MIYCPICHFAIELCECETWICKDCGTVYDKKPGIDRICNYCESQKNKPSAVKISYQALWNGFWAGLEKDPQETYTKSELLSIKNFYEGMVK